MAALSYLREMGLEMTLLHFLPILFFLGLIVTLPALSSTTLWWEKYSNKLIVSVFFSLAGSFFYFVTSHDTSIVFQTYFDYLAFIVVLGSFFVVSGGIHISGAFSGYPMVNTVFLGIGAVLSNLLGTTGASMLLIRPLLHANRHRRHKTHLIIFLIYIVSNCAALLVPLGPPLYLGYLRGVPFLWTWNLLPECGLVTGFLLVVFYYYDKRMFKKEGWGSRGHMFWDVIKARKNIHIQGKVNVLFLLLMVGILIFSGYVLFPALSRSLSEEAADRVSKGFQILFMGLFAFCSWRITPKKIHGQNRFQFKPIQEVAILFFGIFGAMIPSLAILEANGSAIQLTHPWQFFWTSGILSSFLDNAPTYLSYVTLAASQRGINPNHLGELAERFPKLLAAISCGSSFMGAITYVGNAPNFMVKTIAEHAGVKMPFFGAYMLWALVVLGPVFLLVTFLFF